MHNLSKQQKQINTVMLLIFTQVIISATLIESFINSGKQLLIILLKLCIDLSMFVYISIRKNTITEKQALIILIVNRFILLIAISTIRHPDCIYLVMQLCYSIHLNDSGLLFYSFSTNVSGKLGFLIQSLFFRIHQLPFVCSFTLILLDILEYIQFQKIDPLQSHQLQQQLFDINSHPNSPCSVNKNKKEKDNIWIQRIQDVKIQVIILSRKSLKVKYMNSCFQELCCCNTLNEFQEFILNQLCFQIPQQCTELYRNTSIQIKKLRDKQREESKREIQNLESTKNVAAQNSLTLYQILINYKEGKYNELVNASNSKSLDISCSNKFATGNLISLSGSIHCDEKEITIFINDITKQSELSQFKIKEDFKSKIVESFSHEMRTPLNSAINLIQSSLEEPTISQQTKDILLIPAQSSLRLQSFIINDIIDFSNYYTNSLFLENRDFSFTELINELSEMFKFQFQQKNMGFKFDMMQNELTSFNTDYNRLLQIIVNLLQNSIKFSDSGNVIISFKSMTHKKLKISIRDQGFGIGSEKLAQIQKTLLQFQQTQDVALSNQWHGFGLLISSILLSKISPNADSQVIKIKSDGLKQGTKVVIYIENQQNIYSARMSKKSLRLGTSNKGIMVGTVIITSINKQSQVNNLNQTPQFKISDNDLDQNVNDKSSVVSLTNKMDQLDGSSPKLLNHFNNSSPRLKSLKSEYFTQKISQSSDQYSINLFKDLKSMVSVSHKSQIMSIQQIQCLEDYESEQNLLQFEQRKKCRCNRLLSIDDEVFNQHSIKMLLSKLGFEVLIAFNGQQAMDLIATLEKCCDSCQILSLILMDYQMPILDGVQTTKLLVKMMKEKKLPQINIIGLTAFTSEEDVRKCLSAGMFDVLSKPLKLKEFKELLSIM